ncbi:DUF2934 domain-containing protein [Microvirga lotononidis]|uniref:DUF2934 domain-containing protein n=1 Tax=Microvirga lotononidis TaxID=864069 RepID=I4YVZ6_9HYPH|nr:DUF2934 domain-containing protein [Microvirga lotononidis]EIM28138.1 Protein of unknown function (DUF2934) [Microvirga lotononidis]WQO27757.1 DUF2934 domain-containing protein [Microvirga lotononidis]
MDKQIEERIRERAYELWMRHGSIHGRADEYWYQAEQEVLGGGSETEGTKAPIVDPAPLGMTSMTADEELSSPAAPKTRRKRSPAAAPAADAAPGADGGEAPLAAPKRRRTTRAT